MKFLRAGLILVFSFCFLESRGQALKDGEEFFLPVLEKSVHIYDPSVGEKTSWYINDHCIVQGKEGRYHLFGITHWKAIIPPAWAEHQFAHASSARLFQIPWQKHPPALKIDKKLGETHIWAPHIIEKDGVYYMFYAGGGGHWNSMINLAQSTDLFNWRRHPANPLFRDFYDARDPMVFEYNGEYLLYYTKTYSKDKHFSTVAFRRSRDLIHWSEPEFALILTEKPYLINSGHTESPFVFEYKGKFYLSVCSPYYHYRLTRIFVSDNPYHFDEKNEITLLIAHCAEVLNFDQNWYVSHAGWFYDGVYLAPLRWVKAKKFFPQFIFLNAGEEDKYLVESKKVHKGTARLWSRYPTNQVLRIAGGGSVSYKIPLPDKVQLFEIFLCGAGEYELEIPAEDEFQLKKDPSSSEGLDLYWLKFPSPISSLELKVKSKARKYELNFIKIYFLQ